MQFFTAIFQRFKHLIFAVLDKSTRIFLLGFTALSSGWQFIQKPHEPAFNYITYDNLGRHSFFVHHPDSDILILDFDRAFLAPVNEDFDRWGWPRDSLTAKLDWLEQQGVKQ